MNKTILVTGAAGFIGSQVAHVLLERGDTVVGLDNLNDYYDPARKRANLLETASAAKESRAFQFIEGDVRDRYLVGRLFATHAFDAVVHLAAMVGVRVSVDTPALYFDVNLNGTLHLLDAARKSSVGNFVLASTSSVYGNTEQIPFTENDPCDRPLAPYAASKRAAEMLAFTYHHLYQLNVIVLRFFTVYGPRVRPDMMAYMVADNIMFGRATPLYNQGQMHRDWTYIDDIARGVVAAVDRPLGYEVINLGRGQPVLLAAFVRIIERLAGKKANLTEAPMPNTDIGYTYADIDKARRLLGYEPSVDVEDGVTRFWKWYSIRTDSSQGT